MRRTEASVMANQSVRLIAVRTKYFAEVCVILLPASHHYSQPPSACSALLKPTAQKDNGTMVMFRFCAGDCVSHSRIRSY